MSQEDTLTAAVIEQREQQALEEETISSSVEVHYNYYGDRGVVDLVTEGIYGDGGPENSTIEIWEMKGDSAIQSATGANEIIRQFNRHKEYFFKGSEYYPQDYYRIEFNLVFFATETARDHIEANESMYQSAMTHKTEIAGEHASLMAFHPEMDGFAYPLSEQTHLSAGKLKQHPTL